MYIIIQPLWVKIALRFNLKKKNDVVTETCWKKILSSCINTWSTIISHVLTTDSKPSQKPVNTSAQIIGYSSVYGIKEKIWKTN